MILPRPALGTVLRYAFLWSDERAAGATEGAKDRPCVIVGAGPRPGGDLMVLVAPITHSPPDVDDGSVSIPQNVAAQLGLDDHAHWIRTHELNKFVWPGFDLHHPGRSRGRGLRRPAVRATAAGENRAARPERSSSAHPVA